MKITGLKYAGGILALASIGFAYTSSAVPVVLDDFDTFSSPSGVPSGFLITDSTADATAVNDGVDLVPSPADTTFVGLQRVVGVSLVSGPVGASVRANNQSGGIVSFSTDAGADGTLSIRYTLPGVNGQDLNNTWDRFRFLFTRNDSFNAVFSVTLTSTAGSGSATDTISTLLPFIPTGSPQYIDLVFNNLPLSAAYNNAKTVLFTITPADDSADIRFDAAYLDNPNIPEASTTVPALAFAGLIGGWAWRRARAKKA